MHAAARGLPQSRLGTHHVQEVMGGLEDLIVSHDDHTGLRDSGMVGTHIMQGLIVGLTGHLLRMTQSRFSLTTSGHILRPPGPTPDLIRDMLEGYIVQARVETEPG